MKFQIFYLLVFLIFCSATARAQNEIPPAVANLVNVKQGALIIAMDTIYQKLPLPANYFNLKAYGLVNALLQNEIPVMWAIKTGKAKTGNDFTANVTKVFPDTLAISGAIFRSGPFIIDSSWVDEALPVINAFGNQVNVYKLTTNTNIDIRYTLTHKPKIALLNSSGYDTVTVHTLTEAGFDPGSYTLFMPAGQVFNPASSYSLASDSHYSNGDTTHVNPVLRFVSEYGGNLIAQCAALGTFENRGLIMTTGGIDSATTGIAGTGYYNNDAPIGQFHGNLITPQGEYKYWMPKSGSTFRSNTYEVVRDNAVIRHYILMGAKVRPNNEKGGNVFYLPGHDYYFYLTNSINDNNKINGRRIFLNSAFIPPNDSIPGIDFKTDIDISMTAQAGLAVKYEPFQITIVAHNKGFGVARDVVIDAPLPAGLLYSGCNTSAGTFNPGTGKWTLDSIFYGKADTLVLTVLINQLGNITYTSEIKSRSLEYVFADNRDTLHLFGVSRPDAVNDYTVFGGPLTLTYYTGVNDIDEDGGPYGNTSIVAGPYHGTAVVINGDSITYTLGPGFAGIDSLRYVVCDQYPLCDSAWFYITVPTPLPVYLAGFEGNRTKGRVLLKWFTLSEKDNDYFQIERSINGNDFFRIGKVKGYGTTTMLQKYEFTETDPGNPYLYYRLKQFDFNGAFEYSEIIALPLHKKGNGQLIIYPNPGQGDYFVLKADKVDNGSVFQMTDVAGRIILYQEIIPDENGVVLEYLVPGTKLEAGCYLASIVSEDKIISTRVIIR